MRITKIAATIMPMASMRSIPSQSITALAVLLALTVPLSSQSVGTLWPVPQQVVLDASGNVMSGAKATFYLAGSSTLEAPWTDVALSVAHANPVVASAAGRFAAIYLDPQKSYKVTITSSADVLLYTQDNIKPTGSAWKLEPTVLASTATGTQADFSLGTYTTVVRWNGASAATFSGLKCTPSADCTSASDGRRFLFQNVTTAQTAKFTDQDTGSTAANRLDTISNAGQILGGGGSAWLWYDGTSSRWRVDLIDPGAPITPTFAAGDFTGAGGMVWTVAAGDVTTLVYQQHGKLVSVWFTIITTTVGTPLSTDLEIGNGQWGGFTTTKAMAGSLHYSDNGTKAAGLALVNSSATKIRLLNATFINWTASTDLTDVRGQIALEVD